VTRTVRWGLGIAIGVGVAYLLFYLGGNYSFRYTHRCVRSHQQTVFEATPDNAVSHTITVCDRYSGNAKRWSVGDPVRALYAEPLTRWNGEIVVGIALVIGAAVLYNRRKQWTPTASRAGRLAADRAGRLLPFRDWTRSPRRDAWENGYAALRRFAEREGHTRVPAAYVEDGYELGAWVSAQRVAYRHGQLAKERIARLEELPGWVWTTTRRPRGVSEGA
jgi:hypothetical protein